MPRQPLIPLHRISRRAQKRRSLRRTALWAAVFLVLIWSFGAGYLWRQLRTKGLAATEAAATPSEEQRVEALRLLDEGVRARHEGRWQGAMNALTAARRVNAQMRGVDVLVGEIALEQKDPETLRRAVQMALRSGENEAPAKLLRSVEIWMNRGEKGVDQAGPQAKQALIEAAEAEPSSAAVYFFHGELNRLLGESGEAQRNLQAALRRQTPWRSSALLEVKAQLAAREASEAGKSVVAAAPGGMSEAIFALREDGAGEGQSSAVAKADVLRGLPLLQVLALSRDEALAGTFGGTFAVEVGEAVQRMAPRSDKLDFRPSTTVGQ